MSTATAADGWPARALGWVGTDSDSAAATKVRAFQLTFLFCFCTKLLDYNLVRWGQLDPANARHVYYMLGGAIAVTAAIVALVAPRFGRFPWVAAMLVAVWHVTGSFPLVGNHNYLELWILLLAAGLNLHLPEDRHLFLSALKWIVFFVFLYSGLQKLVHGYYFHGEALATCINRMPRFQDGFRYLLSQAELERITRYAIAPGQGPFRLNGNALIVLSNLVYLAELACAALLLVPRTRLVGVVFGIGLMIGIELFAREVFFGLIQVMLVLLFAPSAWLRTLVPVFFASYAVLLLSDVGILPAMRFY
jgi:hypothetical protein